MQMEVLAGARSQTRELDPRRMLNGIAWLPCEPATDFDAAKRIYRTCRRGGITPRGLIDCLIAAIALRTQSAVLAPDADFARLAAVIDIRLDNGSLLPPEFSVRSTTEPSGRRPPSRTRPLAARVPG